jgi:hypothetical protein
MAKVWNGRAFLIARKQSPRIGMVLAFKIGRRRHVTNVKK